ncbi:uncharacterized protein LOC115973235 isoform X3 [Quercus lobata]|uniref:uncharacterized protein LOC115973235 isoform X3 n=1 Tax=Quercus lobata TaxID=97700 RepID=UPI0012484019|nr:uncharacterized protein LOC115973235 isoform X3 [Quercus lobata]XP_030949354.1 uncharacterized protein LOC115973235 isoform X3 [Quercus lobata]
MNEHLTKKFHKEKIVQAIHIMHPTKASGPDGFSASSLLIVSFHMIGRILHITFAPIIRKDFVHVVVVADMNMLMLLEAILLLHLHQQTHAKCMSKFLKVLVVNSRNWSIDCKHFDFGNGNRPFGSS